MFSYQPQITPAAKAQLDAQFSMFSEMSKRMFDTMRRINELNVQVGQTILEESISDVQNIISSQDRTESVSIVAGRAQSASEKLRGYQQHLTSILAETQVDMLKATESHLPETTRTAEAMVEEVARTASAATEKAAQRQKAAMEKISSAIGKSADTNANGQGARRAG